MPIKTIKGSGAIPNNQVGVATNPRAEYNLDELSFEGHSRLINSTTYTNTLNDPKTGVLLYKTYQLQPFSGPLSEHKALNVYQATSSFDHVSRRDGYIICGAPDYSEAWSSASSTYQIGRVFIYKDDGTHVGTIPSPSTANHYSFGWSVDIDPAAGKVFVGALNKTSSTGGRVYVYDWDLTPKFTTSDWGTPTIIQASDRAANTRDYFGFLIKTINTNTGNKVIISATQGSAQAYGRVYVYNYDGSGEVSIAPSDSHYDDLTLYFAGDSVEFGCSIDVDGNPTDGYKLAVGCANWKSDADTNRVGAVFIYNLDGTGEQMILPARVTNNFKVHDAGYNVAIDVAAGKLITCSPHTDNTNYGFGLSHRDNGILQIMDLDGTNQVNIIAPYVTPTNQPTYWPAASKFGLKLGINRSTRRVYAYCDNMGDDGFRHSLVVMDYDTSNGGSPGSNPVTKVALRAPGETSATIPKYTNQEDYPFYITNKGPVQIGQGSIFHNEPDYGAQIPAEMPFEYLMGTIMSNSYGLGGTKKWHIGDDGGVVMVDGGTVFPTGTRTGKVSGMAFGVLIKNLDS